MKTIPNVIPFPVDVEANPFFSALASVPLIALEWLREAIDLILSRPPDAPVRFA